MKHAHQQEAALPLTQGHLQLSPEEGSSSPWSRPVSAASLVTCIGVTAVNAQHACQAMR